MGVHGLWKLLESTGRPINLESLEGKVLAVDVSIWLNQAVLGVHSNQLANPHLQVLFSRICKLLFYRIKPVFVFDGIPPQLKKQTLAARRQRKDLAATRSEKTAERIVKNYLKSHAVRAVMGEDGEGSSKPLPMLHIPRKNETDMFELPPMPSTNAEQEMSGSEDEIIDASDVWASHQEEISSYQDLTQVDINSDSFKALPVEVQHEILLEMKESSKRSSWSKMDHLPKDSHEFASYQMRKLLMKSKLSERLEDLGKEMRTRMSLSMAALLDAENERSEVDAGRVASEDAQHYILMKKDVHKDDEKEDEGKKEAVVQSYGEKAGFSTSLDLQMEKAVRKRSAVVMETASKPSSSSELSRPFMTSESRLLPDQILLSESGDCEVSSSSEKQKVDVIVLDDDVSEAASEGNADSMDFASLKPAIILDTKDKSFILDDDDSVNPRKKVKFDDSAGGEDFVSKTEIEDGGERGFVLGKDQNDSFNMSESVTFLRAAEPLTSDSSKVQEIKDVRKEEHYRTDAERSDVFRTNIKNKVADAAKSATGNVVKDSDILDTNILVEQAGKLELPVLKVDQTKNQRAETKSAAEMQKSSNVNNLPEAKAAFELKPETGGLSEIEKTRKALLASLKRKTVTVREQLKSFFEDYKPQDLEQSTDIPITDDTWNCSKSVSNLKSKKPESEAELLTDDKSDAFTRSINHESTKSMLSLTHEISDTPNTNTDRPSDAMSQEHYTTSNTSVAATREKNLLDDHVTSSGDKLSFIATSTSQDVAAILDRQSDSDVVSVLSDDSAHSDTEDILLLSRSMPRARAALDHEDEDDNEFMPERQMEAPEIVYDEDNIRTSKENLVVVDQISVGNLEESKDAESAIQDGDEEDSEDDFIEVKDAPAHPSWTKQTQRAVHAALSGHDKSDSDYAIENLQESDQEPDLDEWQGVNLNNLEVVTEDLENERRLLETERRKQQKKASSITDTMYADSKELLQCFGLPYIESPQEAEAQCAFLDLTNQTEGTITDDSDIWLFGGRRVYKSFFSKKRDPEYFSVDDIERQLLLSRSKLINLAYLMGSDYTLGVQGVGYVTAMELLNEFKGHGLDALKAFKLWWASVHDDLNPVPSRGGVRGKLWKLSIPADFPNPPVSKAYLKPVIDESEEPFQWGTPDLDLIREFARERFGWMKTKVDENLLPVLKRLNERQIQPTMTTFFSVAKHGDRKIASKRLHNVLQQMNKNDGDDDDDDDDHDNVTKDKKRRKGRTKGRGEVNEQKGEGKKGVRIVKTKSGELKRMVKRKKVPQGKNVKRRKVLSKIKERAELSENSGSESSLGSSEDDEDNAGNADDQSRRKSQNSRGQKRGKKSASGAQQTKRANTRQKRSVQEVNYCEDVDNDFDDDIDDQDLIKVAENVEMELSMKRARARGAGHSLTSILRNVGIATEAADSTSSVTKASSCVSGKSPSAVTAARGRGNVPTVGDQGRTTRGSKGRGKGGRGGSTKGKALVKSKPAVEMGPNLSSSGSDSD